MRYHAFGAQIGKRQLCPARLHQRGCAAANGHEGIAGNIHRLQKGIAWRVQIAPAQILLIGEANGMHQEIQPAPGLFNGTKGGIHIGVIGHIAGHNKARSQAFRQGAHALFQRLTLIGKGNLAPLSGDCLRNAPGDGAVIGHPHDQAALAGHQSAFWDAGCWFRVVHW